MTMKFWQQALRDGLSMYQSVPRESHTRCDQGNLSFVLASRSECPAAGSSRADNIMDYLHSLVNHAQQLLLKVSSQRRRNISCWNPEESELDLLSGCPYFKRHAICDDHVCIPDALLLHPPLRVWCCHAWCRW